MSKTVHVIREDGRWAVKREGHSEVFPTQREAIEHAREIAKRESLWATRGARARWADQGTLHVWDAADSRPSRQKVRQD